MACFQLDRRTCRAREFGWVVDNWPTGYNAVWCLEFLSGDWTDESRYLAPTGRGEGDYTRNGARGMRREPEPLNEHALRGLTEKS